MPVLSQLNGLLEATTTESQQTTHITTTEAVQSSTEQTQLLSTMTNHHPHPSSSTSSINSNSNISIHRHDSESSIDSKYNKNDAHASSSVLPFLNVGQGAVLLTAECLGTGLLALPGNIATLGSAFGFFFLILQLPINWYAGSILHETASRVEHRQPPQDEEFVWETRGYPESFPEGKPTDTNQYSSIEAPCPHPPQEKKEKNQGTSNVRQDMGDQNDRRIRPLVSASSSAAVGEIVLHPDTATRDFIAFTQALFHNEAATRIVRIIYYSNIFLVLGNYVLVMSHSLQAVFVELCLPMAGMCACICMFGVSQLRTMARLGRTASILSLLALLVVVAQCLVAIHYPIAGEEERQQHDMSAMEGDNTATAWLRKFSALGSIGFAVGSQKLFLNIRHELADRPRATQSLALSLSSFGTFYVLLVLLAGSHPPSFLLDAIPTGTPSKRLAGLLLYAHIVVSYAINSQALCSSLDRAYSWRLQLVGQSSPTIRWMIWTAIICIMAYTVANAIPFFSDLVAFIGAITSVPLTLLFPALFWRKINGMPLFGLTMDWSCALTYFSLVFMITATAGSVYSIQQDWSRHGAPFSCQLTS